MKKCIVVMIVGLFLSGQSFARDDKNMYSIEDAMNTTGAKEKLDQGYTFKFGDQTHAAIAEDHGNYLSNKKTNAFGKSDKEACEWAFLSAMVSFQDRIAAEGGNAVVNIHSFYRKNEISSATEYECGTGAIMAGVTFKGDVVTLEE